jgi:hypothetical protein
MLFALEFNQEEYMAAARKRIRVTTEPAEDNETAAHPGTSEGRPDFAMKLRVAKRGRRARAGVRRTVVKRTA